MTVTYKEYEHEKFEFLRSLGEWECETSPMDEYGRHFKTYYGPKGSWNEVMTPVVETVEVEADVHGVKLKFRQEMKFTRTEFYSTKDATSKFYYEKW